MDNSDVIQYVPGSAVRVGRDYVYRTGYMGVRQYDALGNLASHPVSYRKYRTFARPRSRKSNPNNYPPLEVWNGDWGDPTGFNIVPVAIQNAVRDEASTKWYQKVANTNALLPLMFKERQKTIDMVTSYVIGFARYRKNFGRQFRHLWKKGDRRLFEQKWLEYRYGWTPFLNDVNTLINKDLDLPSVRVVAKSGVLHPFTSGNGSGTIRVIGEANFTDSYGAYMVPKNPELRAATLYGIANPSLIIWEMVPFSFAIDWFLDVGGYLESLGALNGLERVSPWRTRERVLSMTSSYDGNTSYTSGFCYHSGKSGIRTIETPSYPNPLVPSNGVNLNRFLDAVALCDNIFKRKP